MPEFTENDADYIFKTHVVTSLEAIEQALTHLYEHMVPEWRRKTKNSGEKNPQQQPALSMAKKKSRTRTRHHSPFAGQLFDTTRKESKPWRRKGSAPPPNTPQKSEWKRKMRKELEQSIQTFENKVWALFEKQTQDELSKLKC